MELLVSTKLVYTKFHGIPWHFSCQRNWRTPSSMEFHGIPWNCSCQLNWRTWSSMEFHGTSRVSEIGTLLIPWNSMELLVSTKLTHFKFHEILWNFSCQRNWRITSSMQFHGTAHVSEIGALGIPWNWRTWNYMELRMRQFRWHEQFHGIPWNSIEPEVRQFRWHEHFHGIPWNCSCKQNWRTPSSMEFHGTARVSEIGAFPVPGNSMEMLVSSKLTHSKFHGMELLVSAKLAHSKFHGIRWNCLCQRNWRTPSSMEFHGTARFSEIGAPKVPRNSMELLYCHRNSMEFHGTARVSEIGAPKVPCNSMEFHGTACVYEIGALLVPWNSMEFHGTARVSETGAF